MCTITEREIRALEAFSARLERDWRGLPYHIDASLLEPHYALIARAYRKRGWVLDTRYKKGVGSGDMKRFLCFLMEPSGPVQLTPKERSFLLTMQSFIEDVGRYPKVGELCDLLLSARHVVRKRGDSLIEKGFLTRGEDMNKGYELTSVGLDYLDSVT